MMLCLPYGAIIASVGYGVFVYLLNENINADGPICKEEPCRSEGIDNSTVNWASDFYLAGWSILLAVHHVRLRKRQASPQGYKSLVFMGLGYLLRGVVNREFSNNGNGDGKGMKSFYIFWPIAYLILTASIYEFSSFTRRAWHHRFDRELKPKCCGIFEVNLFETLVIIAAIAILAGSIWSLRTSDVIVDNAVDEALNDTYYIEPPSVQMVIYGGLAWSASHTMFWIATAAILGSRGTENRIYMWGLPNSLAAAGIIIIHFTTGTFWVAMQTIAEEQDVGDACKTAVTITFHYGMVMTSLFVHNLVSTLPYAGPTKNLSTFSHSHNQGPPSDVYRVSTRTQDLHREPEPDTTNDSDLYPTYADDLHNEESDEDRADDSHLAPVDSHDMQDDPEQEMTDDSDESSAYTQDLEEVEAGDDEFSSTPSLKMPHLYFFKEMKRDAVDDTLSLPPKDSLSTARKQITLTRDCENPLRQDSGWVEVTEDDVYPASPMQQLLTWGSALLQSDGSTREELSFQKEGDTALQLGNDPNEDEEAEEPESSHQNMFDEPHRLDDGVKQEEQPDKTTTTDIETRDYLTRTLSTLANPVDLLDQRQDVEVLAAGSGVRAGSDVATSRNAANKNKGLGALPSGVDYGGANKFSQYAKIFMRQTREKERPQRRRLNLQAPEVSRDEASVRYKMEHSNNLVVVPMVNGNI